MAVEPIADVPGLRLGRERGRRPRLAALLDASRRCRRPTRGGRRCMVAQHGQGQGRRLHGAVAHVAPRLPRRPTTRPRRWRRSATMADARPARRCRPSPRAGISPTSARLAHGGGGRARCWPTWPTSDDRIVVVTADLMYSNRTDATSRAGIPSGSSTSASPSSTWWRWRPGWRRSATSRTSRRSRASSACSCGEQIRTDLAYPGLPVRILAHHAGISLGFYGTSHHATEDLGADALDRRHDRRLPVRRDVDRAAAARDGRRAGPGLRPARPGPRARRLRRRAAGRSSWAASTVLRDGGDLAIVANGITVAAALEAADRLAADGRRGGGARRAHGPPVRRRHDLPATPQRTGPAAGGRGAQRGRRRRPARAPTRSSTAASAACCCAAAGLPADEYALIGPPTHLYRHYQLDADGLESRAPGARQTPLRDGRTR